MGVRHLAEETQKQRVMTQFVVEPEKDYTPWMSFALWAAYIFVLCCCLLAAHLCRRRKMQWKHMENPTKMINARFVHQRLASIGSSELGEHIDTVRVCSEVRLGTLTVKTHRKELRASNFFLRIIIFI